MPGPRQPTDIIKANGRKHLSRAEETQRRAGEVNVPAPKQMRAPKWLPESLRADYRALGKRLLDVGLYTDLDANVLGHYLIAQHHYLLATAQLEIALVKKDGDAAEQWGRIQERHFKQARNCANDMGLTITSRCRLVLPPKEEPEEDEFTALLRRRRAAGD